MPSSGKKTVRQHLPCHPERSSGLTAGESVHRLRRAFRGTVGKPGGVPGFSRWGSLGWGRQDRGPGRAGGWVSGWGLESWRENLHRAEGLRKLGHHAVQTKWHCRTSGSVGSVEQAPVRTRLEDFSGGPVVNNQPSNAGDVGSIPGGGNKIPHAAGRLLSTCSTAREACATAETRHSQKRTGAGC